MTETPAEPQYSAPPLGAYPVDEHLRAQQAQPGPDGKTPVHPEIEQDESAAPVDPAATPKHEAAGDDQGKGNPK